MMNPGELRIPPAARFKSIRKKGEREERTHIAPLCVSGSRQSTAPPRAALFFFPLSSLYHYYRVREKCLARYGKLVINLLNSLVIFNERSNRISSVVKSKSIYSAESLSN